MCAGWQQKNSSQRFLFETSHNQVMYPRYHSNCASERSAALGLQQALCSHAAVTGGVYLPGGRSDLQLGRDGNMRPSAAGLPPPPALCKQNRLVRLRHRFSDSLAVKCTPIFWVCQGGFSLFNAMKQENGGTSQCVLIKKLILYLKIQIRILDNFNKKFILINAYNGV